MLPLLLATGFGLWLALRRPADGSAPAGLVPTPHLPLSLLSLALVSTALMLSGLVNELDHQLLLTLRARLPPGLVGLLGWITHSGSSVFLTMLVVAASGYLLTRGQRANALLLSLSGLAGALLVVMLKMLFARQRPALWDTLELSSFSFPSGHTMGTAACASALAVVLCRLYPAQRRTWWGLALGWVALVGLSRLTLGVHWPSDVFTGAPLGIALTLLVSRLPGCRQQP